MAAAAATFSRRPGSGRLPGVPACLLPHAPPLYLYTCCRPTPQPALAHPHILGAPLVASPRDASDEALHYLGPSAQLGASDLVLNLPRSADRPPFIPTVCT